METCFFAQKLASGKLSIRCKIFYNSKYSNPISLKILLEKEEYWKKGKVYGCKNAKVYNEQINQVDRDLKVIYNRLVSLEEAITSEKIKSIYTNKKLPEKTTLGFVKDFTEKKLNEGWEHDTNRKFRRYYKDFENFLTKRKIKNKILSEFTVKNAIDYFEFLRKIPNSEKISKNKVFYVKSAFDYAKSKELIKNNPLNNLSIKVRLPTPKIVFLFQDERERLEQKNFTGKLE